MLRDSHLMLGRLHDAAVRAATGHAKAEYGTVTARKAYRRYLDANTKFVNELARLGDEAEQRDAGSIAARFLVPAKPEGEE